MLWFICLLPSYASGFFYPAASLPIRRLSPRSSNARRSTSSPELSTTYDKHGQLQVPRGLEKEARLVSVGEEVGNAIHVKSLVWETFFPALNANGTETLPSSGTGTTRGELVLLVLAVESRVNESRVRQFLNAQSLRLAHPREASGRSGFRVGTIPPAFHLPPFSRTLVDAQLLGRNDEPDDIILAGGGGRAGLRLEIQASTLLRQPGVALANISMRPAGASNMQRENRARGAGTLSGGPVKHAFAYFPALLPSTEDRRDATECVTLLVTLSSVRKMAHALVFATAEPYAEGGAQSAGDQSSNGSYNDDLNNEEEDDDDKDVKDGKDESTGMYHAKCRSATQRSPWRFLRDDLPMTVQLIFGEKAAAALGAPPLRSLKRGASFLVYGHVQVGKTAPSTANWLHARQCDVVVHNFSPAPPPPPPPSPPPLRLQVRASSSGSESALTRLPTTASPMQHEPMAPSMLAPATPLTSRAPLGQSATASPEVFLRLRDVYGEGASDVVVVDDDTGLVKLEEAFRSSVGPWGFDCEWMPTRDSSEGEMPVATLQLADRRHCFIIDLQTIAMPRPPAYRFFRGDADLESNYSSSSDGDDDDDDDDDDCDVDFAYDDGTPLTSLQRRLNDCLALVWHDAAILKVGFAGVGDLRKLYASFPHLPVFADVIGFLELGTIAQRAIFRSAPSVTRQEQAKQVGSLSKLCRALTGNALDKEQQMSNWSARPLCRAQIEYAALDAAILPFLLDIILQRLPARMEDPAVAAATSDWRFTILPSRFAPSSSSSPQAFWGDARNAGRRVAGGRDLSAKLGAKPVLKKLVVSQSWAATQRRAAPLPVTQCASNGLYVDKSGRLTVLASELFTHAAIDDLLRSGREPGSSAEAAETALGTVAGASKEAVMDSLVARSLRDAPLPRRLRKPLQEPPLALRDGERMRPRVHFNSRAGLVHCADAEVLFVNIGTSGKYRNEWSGGGRYLSFYLRDHQWRAGQTALAQRLLHGGDGGDSGDGGESDACSAKEVASEHAPVQTLLYARRGKKGSFIWCGRCSAREVQSSTEGRHGSDGDLIELELQLLDYGVLSTRPNFIDLLAPPTPADATAGRPRERKPQVVQEEAGEREETEEDLQRKVAEMVCSGNVAGALVAALDASGTAMHKRSLSAGVGCLKNIIAHSEDPKALEAAELLDSVAAQLGLF